MSNSIDDRPATRVRASEAAITAALNALRATGHHVQALWISGGKVEIRCSPLEGAPEPEKDGGLKDW